MLVFFQVRKGLGEHLGFLACSTPRGVDMVSGSGGGDEVRDQAFNADAPDLTDLLERIAISTQLPGPITRLRRRRSGLSIRTGRWQWI